MCKISLVWPRKRTRGDAGLFREHNIVQSCPGERPAVDQFEGTAGRHFQDCQASAAPERTFSDQVYARWNGGRTQSASRECPGADFLETIREQSRAELLAVAERPALNLSDVGRKHELRESGVCEGSFSQVFE